MGFKPKINIPLLHSRVLTKYSMLKIYTKTSKSNTVAKIVRAIPFCVFLEGQKGEQLENQPK